MNITSTLNLAHGISLNLLYQSMTCCSTARKPGSWILDHPLHGKIHQQIKDIQVKQLCKCLSNDWKM